MGVRIYPRGHPRSCVHYTSTWTAEFVYAHEPCEHGILFAVCLPFRSSALSIIAVTLLTWPRAAPSSTARVFGSVYSVSQAVQLAFAGDLLALAPVRTHGGARDGGSYHVQTGSVAPVSARCSRRMRRPSLPCVITPWCGISKRESGPRCCRWRICPRRCERPTGSAPDRTSCRCSPAWR